jgi:hypothetical protein
MWNSVHGTDKRLRCAPYHLWLSHTVITIIKRVYSVLLNCTCGLCITYLNFLSLLFTATAEVHQKPLIGFLVNRYNLLSVSLSLPGWNASLLFSKLRVRCKWKLLYRMQFAANSHLVCQFLSEENFSKRIKILEIQESLNLLIQSQHKRALLSALRFRISRVMSLETFETKCKVSLDHQVKV